jgi:hypothetical protein
MLTSRPAGEGKQKNTDSASQLEQVARERERERERDATLAMQYMRGSGLSSVIYACCCLRLI